MPVIRSRRARRSARPAPAPCRFEPIEPRLLLDGVPFAVADAADNVEVVYVRDGDLILFDQSADGWREQNFGSWIPSQGEQFIPNSATNWLDPKDGRIYHALNSPGALYLVLDDEDSRTESVRVLTLEIEDAETIASRITSFVSTDGLVHVAGLSASGDVVMYRQTGTQNHDGGFAWEFVNISRDHLAPQGLATPDFAGDLTSYVTSWNGLNIAGLDHSGNVHSVWWAPGVTGNLWQTANLSHITGAPTLSGNLSVYLTSWSGINIAGIDPDGKIVVTWWVPQFEGDWEVTNFSDAFGAPGGGGFVPGTIMSYTTPWGGLNVGGVDADGGLTLYWWVPQFGGQWQVAADFIPGAEDFSDRGIYGFTSPAGTINLVGTNDAGDVIRYHWRSDAAGGQWSFENLDSLSTPISDDFGGDDATGIQADPALEPLAGSWAVTISSDILPLNSGDDDDPPAVITLRADGAWTSPEAELGLVGSISTGAWTYSGGVITLHLPEIGHTSGHVSPHAARFTTTGITLLPSTLQRMEQALQELDQQFPESSLREQIESAGGIAGIMADILITWTRV